MSTELWLGLCLALVAGIMAGNCMLPMKFIRRWNWENTWLLFSLVSLIVIPWSLAWLSVESLGTVYASLPAREFAAPLLYGAGWGIAQVLFGLSIARLGLALGYAVIIGLGALLGTLVPLLYQRREVLATQQGSLILSGVAIMMAGIAVSSWAGRRREMAEQKPASDTPRREGGTYAAALLVAVICGLMAPMLNYSFAFGQGIAEEAVRTGTSAANASYAVWPVGLAGGLVPNLAYCVYLLFKNGSWGKFRMARRDVFLACAMGGLWMGSMALYGRSAVYLGALGTSVGWALFQIFMIMTANVSGVVTGEWRAASRGTRSLLWTGLLLLAVATAVISLGNR